MKKLLILSIIISSDAFGSIDTFKIKEPTVLEIKDGKEIFQTKSDPIEKYMGGIIALVTVIGSAFISYKIARHQTKKQEEINEKQIETQIEIAKQQLDLNNRQLAEQSRIAIESVRANNISNARINWIEELRPILGKLISDTSIFEFELKRRLKNSPKKQLEIGEPIYQKFADLNLAYNEVKLFLNHDEEDHLKFIQLVDKYIANSIEIASGLQENPNEINEDILVTAARKILKNTWEQAKNEVQKK